MRNRSGLMRFLRSCLKLSADKISSAALAFINGKDQLHVMPKNPEHRIIENRRIEGLTPVSSFGSAIEMVEGSEPYRLTWSNMPAAQISRAFFFLIMPPIIPSFNASFSGFACAAQKLGVCHKTQNRTSGLVVQTQIKITYTRQAEHQTWGFAIFSSPRPAIFHRVRNPRISNRMCSRKALDKILPQDLPAIKKNLSIS